MDKTLNKLVVAFCLLILFDATSFSITVEKTRFNVLGSVVKVANSVNSTIKSFK